MSLFFKPGSAERFEALAAEYEKSVYLTCLSMLRNREDAQDALQETMLRAFKAYASFDHRASAKTWLHRIAINVCIDEIRKKKNVVSLDEMRETGFDPADPGIGSYGRLEEKERKRLLSDALEKLPDEMRAVITLRDIRGLSYEEVAEALELPLGTVKSKLSRAREKLAKILSRQAELFGRRSV